MDLKYKRQIDEFEDCESSNCLPKQRNAFRWVFEYIDNPDNFLPRYLLKPKLRNKHPNCLGYALSMFDEADQAKKRISDMYEDKRNIYKVLGTHLGEGILTAEQGISNVSSKHEDNLGHFSFFEYSNIDLSKTFVVKEKIERND